jgi:hypothetical protein
MNLLEFERRQLAWSEANIAALQARLDLLHAAAAEQHRMASAAMVDTYAQLLHAAQQRHQAILDRIHSVEAHARQQG